MPRSLNVIVDGRALVGVRTGIGVHTAEIASRLDLAPAALIASHARIENRELIEHCRFIVDRAPLGVLWQQWQFPARARRENADVLWCPHGTLPLKSTIPAVVTVHDFTSMSMKGSHRLRTIASFNLLISRSVKRASAIACVSKTTADELMRRFDVSATRISIVPNGVSSFFSPDESGALPDGLERHGYVLYAGTLEPRKGLNDLLAAWSALPKPRPRLVLTGASGWGTKSLLKELAPLRASGEITTTGYVTRETLRSLYRNALLFAYPSLYEGFGMPPLEAMACGTPVVTTDGGAIPEVVGNAALVVRAGDRDALSSAFRQLLGDGELRAQLAAKGLARAREFSWDRSTTLMSDLLVSAAGLA